MTCKALFIDFDGTIIDSESVLYGSWRTVYETFGIELDLDCWVTQIRPAKPHDSAYSYLCSHLQNPPSQQAAQSLQRQVEEGLMAHCGLRPGIEELLIACNRRFNIPVTIVSSSAMSWIAPQLSRLRIATYVTYIVTSETIQAKKPDPACFLYALNQVRRQPEEVFAIEDSPQGIAAAKKAGISVMAFPNRITELMDLTGADMTICNGLEAVAYLESGYPPAAVMEGSEQMNTFD